MKFDELQVLLFVMDLLIQIFICRHRVTVKQVAKYIDGIVLINTVIPLLQKVFIHFCDCGKRSVAVLYYIRMTKMLVSGKIYQLKSPRSKNRTTHSKRSSILHPSARARFCREAACALFISFFFCS